MILRIFSRRFEICGLSVMSLKRLKYSRLNIQANKIFQMIDFWIIKCSLLASCINISWPIDEVHCFNVYLFHILQPLFLYHMLHIYILTYFAWIAIILIHDIMTVLSHPGYKLWTYIHPLLFVLF